MKRMSTGGTAAVLKKRFDGHWRGRERLSGTLKEPFPSRLSLFDTSVVCHGCVVESVLLHSAILNLSWNGVWLTWKERLVVALH